MTTSWDIPSWEEDEKPKEIIPAIEGKPADATEALIKFSQEAGVEIPAEGKEALIHFMNVSRHGHQASMPMKCKGKQCPLIDMCPLNKINAELPVGKRCPVESALVEQWISTYLTALEIDPTDPESAVDVHMVYEMAGLELIRNRTASYMADNPDMVRRDIVGYSPQGEEIWDDKPNMGWLLMEKQLKAMNKVRDALLATRKSQAQVGHLAGDVTIKTSNMLKRAKELAERRAAKSRGEAQEADFEIVDDDA
jgi:hypothetical protein